MGQMEGLGYGDDEMRRDEICIDSLKVTGGRPFDWLGRHVRSSHGMGGTDRKDSNVLNEWMDGSRETTTRAVRPLRGPWVHAHNIRGLVCSIRFDVISLPIRSFCPVRYHERQRPKQC